MSAGDVSGPGMEPRAETLPLSPAGLLVQSIARFDARGRDGAAIIRRASENLQHWRVNPVGYAR